jgi:hypothetical protein
MEFTKKLPEFVDWELHQGTINGPLSKLFLMHSYPSYVAI